MSALVKKQSEFLRQIARLILAINSMSHEGKDVTVTAGDFHARSGHMKGSLHYSRLAADLNLFVGGVYIQSDHPIWHAIGSLWKSYHPDHRWGGDFKSRDLNHFSRAHGGKA